MKRFVTALGLLSTLSCPVFAQWQVDAFGVPVGRGPGKTGFAVVGPCTAGIPIIGAGASTNPACGTVLLVGGGLGFTTITAGDIVYGSASNTMGKLTTPTGSAFVLRNGGGVGGLPVWGQLVLSQDVSGRLNLSNIVQGTARSVLGVTGNAGADFANIQGTTNQVLRVDTAGTGLSFGAVNIASASAVTGILPTANGGVDQTAWSTYTPTVTCAGGSGTVTGNAGRYKLITTKTMIAYVTYTYSALGTCTPGGNVDLTLPPSVTPVSSNLGGIGLNISTNGSLVVKVSTVPSFQFIAGAVANGFGGTFMFEIN